MPSHKIEISLDVLNLLNTDRGWVRTTGVNQNVTMYNFRGLDKVACADFGKPHYEISPSTVRLTERKADHFVPDNILTRWAMQLGIRYTM